MHVPLTVHLFPHPLLWISKTADPAYKLATGPRPALRKRSSHLDNKSEVVVWWMWKNTKSSSRMVRFRFEKAWAVIVLSYTKLPVFEKPKEFLPQRFKVFTFYKMRKLEVHSFDSWFFPTTLKQFEAAPLPWTRSCCHNYWEKELIATDCCQ